MTEAKSQIKEINIKFLAAQFRPGEDWSLKKIYGSQVSAGWSAKRFGQLKKNYM